jgi:hypothetical protein
MSEEAGSGGTVFFRSIISVQSTSTGKRYAEVVVDFISLLSTTEIGFTTDSTNSTRIKINGGCITVAGNIETSGDTVGSDLGAGTNSDVYNLAIDHSTGKVWFGKNGIWAFGGDPAAGTGQSATLTIGTYFVGFCLYQTNSKEPMSGPKATIRTQSSQFTGTIPSGFSPWYP